MGKSFFVTTPIYYINDVPHIGHVYATFAADILARYHRQKGDETFFLTGTDENSQKTVIAAKKVGKDIVPYTDELAAKWQGIWKKLGVSNDDFIRTTEDRHKKVVAEIFEKIHKNGDLYKGRYEGLYCVGHEAFLKEDDLDEQGRCPDHQAKPDHIVEENYFFKLSRYQDKLIQHFKNNLTFVEPKERYNEIFNFIKSGLQDISVTRQTQKWGIQAPKIAKQIIYVWFDALINYISANPKKWPADVHIIGKDILRFHAVIWPAMLISAGYPLPKKIFAHGFFTIGGQKISKSLGNAVEPVKIADEYGIDALRYFLFKEFPFGNDGDFSFERLEEVYNADLANGLGNLVARVTKLCETADLLVDQNVSKPKPDPSFTFAVENLKFQEALSFIWSKITKADQLIDQTKPWELIKKDNQKAAQVITSLIEQIREIKAYLVPFLPETAEKIEKQFKGPKIRSGVPLFPRIS
ncbi:MAG: methionine--tRNA ligase [Candidatus Woykebacteria bacterium RBG_16_43_9]|uniref:Methionine--tRNA ligase n=1 Tax=Candidatus Woykebacteria bacterium RBG_16_43_9 TaxID=1802596 RepID=A0A1G1WE12_9BACT|nr:MAG: methionine--tRNA ligase [Candidatus Woykebacteria bacterium RBG_16_43_9]